MADSDTLVDAWALLANENTAGNRTDLPTLVVDQLLGIARAVEEFGAVQLECQDDLTNEAMERRKLALKRLMDLGVAMKKRDDLVLLYLTKDP